MQRLNIWKSNLGTDEETNMPTAYELARKEIGTFEWADGSNPKVIQYFADAGHPEVVDDDVAWCAAFVGAMMQRAGSPKTGKLNARSYQNWGEEVPLSAAKEGDVVIFWRGSPDSWKGHVGFFVRREGDQLIVLGGNQRNQVCESKYGVDRLLSVRRLPEKTRAKPTQSKTIQASALDIGTKAGAGITALAALDGYAQYIVLGFLGVGVLFSLWIMRDRLKKWADGVR
jgi:uncharacterized protein (TIGR02594 family)